MSYVADAPHATASEHALQKYVYHRRSMKMFVVFCILAVVGLLYAIYRTDHLFILSHAVLIAAGAWWAIDHRNHARRLKNFIDINHWE